MFLGCPEPIPVTKNAGDRPQSSVNLDPGAVLVVVGSSSRVVTAVILQSHQEKPASPGLLLSILTLNQGDNTIMMYKIPEIHDADDYRIYSRGTGHNGENPPLKGSRFVINRTIDLHTAGRNHNVENLRIFSHPR